MPILEEAAERNHATLVRDGYEMTVSDRMAAVGGQVATLTTPNGTYEGRADCQVRRASGA